MMNAVQNFTPVDTRSTRVAPAEPARSLQTAKERQTDQAGTVGTAKEEKWNFDKLSEEDKKKLEEKLSKLNDSIASYGKILRFKYNEEANQTYVEVLDSKTQEVVASLPPEFLVELSVKMKEMIGIFLDKKL
jgi:flagellar protein FlaG